MELLATLINWYKSLTIAGKCSILNCDNKFQRFFLLILLSMNGRKWQIIKRLNIYLNEECLHRWTTCLEQISKFIFFWLWVRVPLQFHFLFLSNDILEQFYIILILLTFMVNWQGIKIKRIRFKLYYTTFLSYIIFRNNIQYYTANILIIHQK